VGNRIFWKSCTVLLALSVFFGSGRIARACDVPTPVKSIDPPGFYDEAAGYDKAVKPMRGFISQLNHAADTNQWSCTLDLLEGWAKADALMGPISGYQGYYERSWAGTDFALVLLRVPPEVKNANAKRLPVIYSWLGHIAVATRDSDAINHLHNNLVYWAGLNLVAIGTVAHRRDLIDAGLARAREGIHDIGPDGALEREVKRGDRALHYHTFALIPLVFTAQLALQRNVDLYKENNHAIGRLANLVINGVISPASFAKITPIKQNLFPWTFRDELSWMEPYYAHTKDPRLPKLIASRRPFSEWRLGGNVTASWGVPLPTAATN
jgi:poly(beta-D-mannuronate) lyase